MKRLQRIAWAVIGSRATSPLVIGFFLLFYIGIAFITDDTLVYLMELTKKSLLLTVMLALLPLNRVARIFVESRDALRRRRMTSGDTGRDGSALFDEAVQVRLPSPAVNQSTGQGEGGDDVPVLEQLRKRLTDAGYTAARNGSRVSGARGITVQPARLLFLAGTFCLFAGILVSLTTRTTERLPLVEGEPLPGALGGGGMVERISLDPPTGAILSKNLKIRVDFAESGGGGKEFGIYPPAILRGYFVYPRYLGIAALVRVAGPDLPPYEKHAILNIYPPGKEDRLEVPGTPYRLVFSMAEPGDGSDPFISGKIVFPFKLLKGEGEVVSGSVPLGGAESRGGYRIEVPDARRMVITDFVGDYGVLLIWGSAFLLVAAALVWFPVRLFFPRRQMLFVLDGETVHAYSRAEGGRRDHDGIFHELLDLLETGRAPKPSLPPAP